MSPEIFHSMHVFLRGLSCYITLILVLQLKIEARDRGTPSLFSTADFIVRINFNLYPPEFSPQPCVRNVLETSQDTFFYTILATDDDFNNAGVTCFF